MEQKGKWKTIAIKPEVYDEIKKFIEEHPERGYVSVAEFVRAALRRKMEELKLRETEG